MDKDNIFSGTVLLALSKNMSADTEYELYCKVPELLKQNNIRLTEFSKITGIRIATLSNMFNLKYTTINIQHLLTMAKALNVSSVSELYELRIKTT